MRSLSDRYLLPAVERRASDYRSLLEQRPGAPEVRMAPLEVRDVDTKTLTVVGRAIVFETRSVNLGSARYPWFEVIQRGAVRKVLAGKPDVRLLVNHDGLPFARTKNGTLKLREAVGGLDFEATLAPIDEARSLVTLIERGDIDQMSFAMGVALGGSEWEELGDGSELRTVREIAHLPEISIVTLPAYEATSAAVSRSVDGAGSQEVPTDREEVEDDAVDQGPTDTDAAPDPAGATVDHERSNALALDGIAARRRRHGAQTRA